MPRTADFIETYEKLGINPFDLGCIMLDVYPLVVTSLVPDGEKDLYYSENPRLPYAQGAVGEKSAHITLLHGLIEKGHVWRNHVDAVLDGWVKPDTIEIQQIGSFPSMIDGEDYSCIVAHIKPTPELLEANQRLKFLPHIDGFPEYKPHVTLAYVKNGPSDVEWARNIREKWVMSLATKLTGTALPTLGIDYGG
jgi:2'-5' RNA ligase